MIYPVGTVDNGVRRHTSTALYFYGASKKSIQKSRARILKHLLEAEKSTFRGELSFQRSECTAGLTVATIFCVVF